MAVSVIRVPMVSNRPRTFRFGVAGDAQSGTLRQIAREHHRLRGHVELLHGHDAAEHARPPVRQHGNIGVFFDHPHTEAVQTDQTLARAENTHTHVQSVRQGANVAGVLLGAGHRRVRQSRVLRRTVAGE